MGQMNMLGAKSDRLRGFSVEDALLAAVIKGERNAQSLRLRQFMGRVVEHTDKTTVRDGELDFGPRKEMSVEEAIRSAAREQYGISDESIAEAQMLIDKKEAQYADGRLSVGQDGVRDGAVYEMARDLVSDAVGKDNVIEVSDAEAHEMIGTREDAVLMGSRTKTKMKAIEDYYADKDLDENARAVVDVFSGKRDNVAIEVESQDGKRRVIMRQGNERKAGTRHSLFRHFGTQSDNFTIDEITFIPEVIAKGQRSAEGKRVAYDYTETDGTRLRLTTEIASGSEIFTNFYTNRKPLQSESGVTMTTQRSARTTEAEVMGTKVSENSENSAKDNVKYSKEWILSTPGGVVYGWTAGGKIYLNRDAMNPDAPIHEYTHLWDEMLRKRNPALWLRGKELLKRTSLWQEVLDDANYADIRADEDAVASEVHSRLTGREGAKLLAGILADGRIKPMERAGVLSQVKAWIADMYRELRGTFEKWSGRDLSKLSVEDFTRMTLRDLADGVNPRDYIVPESDARFSIRTEGAPRKTKTAYAAFVMLRDKDGKLSFHPKMIKGDSAGTPVRTWLNADTGIISRDRNGNIITNTLGRISVQNNSIDKNGKAPKSTPLAWRPGKHLAPYPNASQFKLGNGKMQGNIIFAEVEYAADKDYQTQAWEYGINANGKYVHSQAGLPYIPKDGFYMYRTNARPDVPAMIITGAYKVNRFLTDAEAKKLNQAAGGEWIERDGATIDKAFLRENGISDEQLEARKSEFDTSKLEGPRDESAKVMELEAYTPRAINFDDVNLKAAAKENGQNLDDYRNNYKTPQERGWRRENALNDGTLERPGANVGGGIEAEAVESMGVRMGVRVVVDRTLGSRGAYNPKTGEVRVNPDARKEMSVEEAIRAAAREQYGISDESIAEAQMLIDKKEAQYADGRLSVGQDGVRDDAVYEMTRNLVSDAVGKDNVIEVSDAEAREMIGNKKTPVTGLPNRANEKQTSGSVLLSAKGDSSSNPNVPSEAEAKIVNNTQSVKNKIRKFNNGDAIIDSSESKGERIAHGDKIAYDYVIGDGLRLRLTTEISKGREVFTNLISNRKPQEVESRKPFGDTQSSAQATTSEVSDAKVGEKFHIGKHVKGEVSSGLSQEQVKDMDARYMEAVERGDMEQAQAMVDEAAKRAGYSADSGYHGTSAFNGAAPCNGYGWSKEERREHWDAGDFEGDWTLGDQIDGMDNGDLEFRLFDSRGERSLSEFGLESARNLRAAYKNPERKITVYRSVPSEVREGSLRDGDWVTPSRAYAKDNAAVHGWGRKYRIIEQEVDVDELWWDGNECRGSHTLCRRRAVRHKRREHSGSADAYRQERGSVCRRHA